MRSFRAKPVGWRGESHRHYLAAKGISTKYYAKFKRDNPGGEWLEIAKRKIEEQGTRGPLTAYADFEAPVEELNLPGEMGEHKRIKEGNERVAELAESMRKEGWQGEPVMVFVNHDGSVTIGEGNHRVRAAKLAGLEKIPVDVRYFAGSEDIEGEWSLDNLQKKYMAKKDTYRGFLKMLQDSYADEGKHFTLKELEKQVPKEEFEANIQMDDDDYYAMRSKNKYGGEGIINWRDPKPGEVVEWWTPEEFVKRTHGGSDVRNVAMSAPNYGDDELGTQPTYKMPDRLAEAKEVDLLKAIHSPEPNASINDGRHRAYSAWSLGDEKVPVVVKVEKQNKE